MDDLRIGVYSQIPTAATAAYEAEHEVANQEAFLSGRDWLWHTVPGLRPDFRVFMVRSDHQVKRDMGDYGQPVVRQFHADHPELEWFPDKAIVWAHGNTPYPAIGYAIKRTQWGFFYKWHRSIVNEVRFMCDIRTGVHELFHLLGLGHAGTIDERGNLKTTNDHTSVMSYDKGGVPKLDTEGLTPVGLYKCGAQTKVLSLRSSGAARLIPGDTDPRVIPAGEHALLKCSPNIYVALRGVYGKFKRPVTTQNQLYVYQLSDNGVSLWLKPTLRPGESRTVGDWTIYYEAFAEGVAYVEAVK